MLGCAIKNIIVSPPPAHLNNKPGSFGSSFGKGPATLEIADSPVLPDTTPRKWHTGLWARLKESLSLTAKAGAMTNAAALLAAPALLVDGATLFGDGSVSLGGGLAIGMALANGIFGASAVFENSSEKSLHRFATSGIGAMLIGAISAMAPGWGYHEGSVLAGIGALSAAWLLGLTHSAVLTTILNNRAKNSTLEIGEGLGLQEQVSQLKKDWL